MKRLLSFLFVTCCCICTICAAGTVKFTVSGVQQGDNPIVTLEAGTYLTTLTIEADGGYAFNNVPTGEYYVKIEAAGYNIPAAQKVIVHEDGSIDPVVGLKLAITKMSENPNEWIHSWQTDGSTSGYVTTSHINTQPEIEFLGKKIVPSDVPSMSILYNNYHIILSDEGEAWTQEYAYRLLETMKTLPCEIPAEKFDKFTLTSSSIDDDIKVEDLGEGKHVTISKDAFYYANPFLVSLDGVRGRFFSKRLHHALTKYVTDFGNDKNRVDEILRNRFGCSIFPPSYEELTAGITNEDASCFQEFIASELVSIINMYEEMPEGFHKTPHLNYLIRRQNGHPHPLYPNAAAVAWPVDNGYIEFMENSFGGNNEQFETLRLILHEKAHFLWAFTFSDEIKNDWITLGGWYEDPNAADGWSTTKDTEFVSAYAHAKNPNEDMAESVAHYLKNPELLMSRALGKYEFIRDRIMHGTRYISKIPDHLTFEVLNLHPDYDYPGKIKRLDVKVTGAPDEDKVVTVDVELQHLDGFEDGASHALTRITSPEFVDNGEKKTQFYDMWLNQVDGDDHHLRGEIHISKYSKSGYWTAGDIVITDLQGNQRFEGRNDCVWNCYVNNPKEDVESPKYVKGSLQYNLTDSVMEGRHVQNLHVSYKVTDDTGISSTFIRLSRVGNTAYYSTGDLYGTYDEATQTAHFDFPIKDFYQDGDYYVSHLTVRDLARTELYVPFSESPLHEPVKKIHISTPDPDYETPQLDINRITVYAEPTHPEAPDGETLVTINYYARDNKSGLELVAYKLRDPQGIEHIQYHYHRNFYNAFFDGDPTVWERYTIKCVLPQGSAPGIWGISEITMGDKAMNERTYNFVETLIFEPDDSDTDYVLFSELGEDNMLDIKVLSDVSNGYGYTYRVIQEETGMEISGTYTPASANTRSGTSASTSTQVDISALPDGKIILIVNVTDANGEIVSVKSTTMEKKSTYTVTYMVDGIEYKTVTYKLGETILPETAPKKDGYAFSGWNEIPETMPAGDVVVTGTFPNLLGDAADRDGVIAVNDYEQIVRICLEKIPVPDFGTLDYNIADANVDEAINVADIAEVVNLINDMPYMATTRLTPMKAEENTDRYSVAEVRNGAKKEYVVSLHNSRKYVAGQMDIVLPVGASVTKESLGSRAATHTLHSNVLSDGRHRIIISSLQNAAFADNGENVILRMEVDEDINVADIKLEDVMFTDRHARLYNISGGSDDDTTSIIGVGADDTDGQEMIFSIDGRRQNRLLKGINILRGKDGKNRKVVMK